MADKHDVKIFFQDVHPDRPWWQIPWLRWLAILVLFGLLKLLSMMV